MSFSQDASSDDFYTSESEEEIIEGLLDRRRLRYATYERSRSPSQHSQTSERRSQTPKKSLPFPPIEESERPLTDERAIPPASMDLAAAALLRANVRHLLNEHDSDF